MPEIPTKKINELETASKISDSDIVIAQTSDSIPKTQKVTISLLLNKIKTWLLTIAPFIYLSSVNKNIQDQINSLNNNKSSTNHTHDDRYFTESEINNKLSPMATSISTLSNNKLDKSGGIVTGDLTIKKMIVGFSFITQTKQEVFASILTMIMHGFILIKMASILTKHL